MNLEFFVNGLPKPAGSKRAFVVNRRGDGKPMAVVVDGCAKSRDWKTTVSWEAKRAAENQRPFSGPIEATFRFLMPRPKGHYGEGNNSDVLKPSSPAHVITMPDLLKLARAVEDALTGVLYEDDSQIVREHLLKDYTDKETERSPGVWIKIVSLEKTQGKPLTEVFAQELL